MKSLIAMLLLVSVPILASDPLKDYFKKGADAEKKRDKELEKRMKKYGIKEVEGTRVIGISAEYYIINGAKVPCSDVEMKCVNGKCTLVPKK